MQIILMEKVANLGNLGDLLKVKDGYARNFLIPKGKAKRATPAALKEFEAKRAELEGAAAEKLAAAQAYAEKLGGVVVRIARKAGVDGRLFGSVTNFDVADGLQALGFNRKVGRAHARRSAQDDWRVPTGSGPAQRRHGDDHGGRGGRTDEDVGA
jgi:large subunit ribosomal protein L9